MFAIIVIECDEDNEVIAHLDVVKKQLKKKILDRRKNDPNCDLSIIATDDNCYGSHRGTIEYFELDPDQISITKYLA